MRPALLLLAAWLVYAAAGLLIELHRRSHPDLPLGAGYRLLASGPTPELSGRRLPTVEVDGSERPIPAMGATGTAFALPTLGTWATARHVVDGCRRIAVEFGQERHRVTDVIVPLRGDAAIVLTDASEGSELGLGAFAGKMRGSELPVFAMGYPKSRSGAVIAHFMHEVVVAGRFGRAVGAVWAVDRRPLWLRDGDDLGGMSGGPVVDGAGLLRGIAVAGNPRRRWLITVDPRYATEPAAAAVLRPPRPPRGPLSVTPGLVDAVNERLQASGAITRVLCAY